MRKVGLSTKLTMTVGILASLIVTIAAISIGVLVYIQTEQQIRKQLSNVSTLIINEYLMHDQGRVSLQKKDEGQSLVILLRNMDMSLLLMDATGSAIAEYGIYRNISGPDKHIMFTRDDTRTFRGSSGGVYVDKELSQVGRVDTFTVPLRKGADIIGFMQLTRINNIWPIIIQSLVWALLIQLPITWIAAVYVIRWGTRHTLAPLSQLVSTVETMDVDHLPEHLAQPPRMDHDVRLLYQTLRTLMTRVRSTLLRQREISQNVSHEFKTPLTRVTTRLSLIVPHVSSTQKEVIRTAMKELVGLGQQVDGLLDMAIYESSAAQKTSHAIFLKPLIEDIGAKLPKSKKVSVDIPPTMKVSIPVGHARTIWRNLLENAAKYGSPGGVIDVTAHESSSTWSVVVSNATDKKTVLASHIFIRYYRGFVSRSIQGHGLGMAIVRDVCTQLDLEVKYKVDDDGSRVTVEVLGKA